MIAVLDYGIGNLRSAQKGLERVAGDGVEVRLATSAAEAAGATGVVLPGVGAFGRCMQALTDSGLDVVAKDAISSGTPFLGVCIGMQMLFEGSEEDVDAPGLGVLPGHVRLLPDDVKRPQMQWNTLEIRHRADPLFAGIDDGAWVYFVHSYAATTASGVISAVTDYGGPMVAAVAMDNLWATQFHPEKSGTVGLRVLANFARMCAR
ncbi:MAG: imidazole glycerol phosphate synthase subunit HisH [Acidimicrobiales bacterium]